MGMIEEGRQLFQDFVAPEIRAIEARLDAIEKQVASLDAKTDKRSDQLETKTDKRSDQLEAKIDRNQTQLMDTLHRMENYSQVMERLARLEGKLQNVA
jgi:tetrahydromethanopterin S-methyltransferase subunit G